MLLNPSLPEQQDSSTLYLVRLLLPSCRTPLTGLEVALGTTGALLGLSGLLSWVCKLPLRRWPDCADTRGNLPHCAGSTDAASGPPGV